MCELLGMSARLPASITISLNEFARHGGETGPHADGWGIAYYDGPDANLIRESTSASRSGLMSMLRGYRVESQIVIAHIRRASLGPVELRNTHPFRRELAGRVHSFAHNGDLPGVDGVLSLQPGGGAMPIGETDSEYAFCCLMQRLAMLWKTPARLPTLAARTEIVAEFAAEIGALGPANFLYSDGDLLFVHGHRRTQADGSMRAPGLHTISVACDYGVGRSELGSLTFESSRLQQVVLVSTLPLTDGDWQPLSAGELLVLRGGEIVDRVDVAERARSIRGLPLSASVVNPHKSVAAVPA